MDIINIRRKFKLITMLIVYLLIFGNGISNSLAEQKNLYSIETGYLLNQEFIPSNSFSPSDMVTIKIRRFDKSPITSFSFLIADFDITNLIINDISFIENEDYTDVYLPELPAVILSKKTNPSNNFITLIINGKSYFTILPIDISSSIDISNRQQRLAPLLAYAITTCGKEAAQTTFDMVFDIFKEYLNQSVFQTRQPFYLMVYHKKEYIATNALESCIIGVSTGGAQRFAKFFKNTAFFNKIKSYIDQKIDLFRHKFNESTWEAAKYIWNDLIHSFYSEMEALFTSYVEEKVMNMTDRDIINRCINKYNSFFGYITTSCNYHNLTCQDTSGVGRAIAIDQPNGNIYFYFENEWNIANISACD
jgi:hypothetical protein